MKTAFFSFAILLMASTSFAQGLADNLVYDSARVQQKASSQLKEMLTLDVENSVSQMTATATKLGLSAPIVTVVDFQLTQPCKFISEAPAYETMNFGKQGTEIQYSCSYTAKLSTGKVISAIETASFLKN